MLASGEVRDEAIGMCRGRKKETKNENEKPYAFCFLVLFSGEFHLLFPLRLSSMRHPILLEVLSTNHLAPRLLAFLHFPHLPDKQSRKQYLLHISLLANLLRDDVLKSWRWSTSDPQRKIQ